MCALAAGDDARHEVEGLLREADLGEQDRVALVVALLRVHSTTRQHPADLAVCAFVAMGYDDFTVAPEPFIDLRARLLDLTETDHPTT